MAKLHSCLRILTGIAEIIQLLLILCASIFPLTWFPVIVLRYVQDIYCNHCAGAHNYTVWRICVMLLLMCCLWKGPGNVVLIHHVRYVPMSDWSVMRKFCLNTLCNIGPSALTSQWWKLFIYKAHCHFVYSPSMSSLCQTVTDLFWGFVRILMKLHTL